MKSYKGGCSCGAVRFEIGDHPLWILACHCDACKKRTGSAYGVSVMFENKSVKQFTGETRTYVRSGDSGNKVRYEFCPHCGTTLRWHVDIVPDRQAFAGGAFDDMKALTVIAEMYTDDATPWARVPCDLSQPIGPDNTFRNLMVAAAKSSRPLD
jgi:hypothetical protein